MEASSSRFVSAVGTRHDRTLFLREQQQQEEQQGDANARAAATAAAEQRATHCWTAETVSTALLATIDEATRANGSYQCAYGTLPLQQQQDEEPVSASIPSGNNINDLPSLWCAPTVTTPVVVRLTDADRIVASSLSSSSPPPFQQEDGWNALGGCSSCNPVSHNNVTNNNKLLSSSSRSEPPPRGGRMQQSYFAAPRETDPLLWVQAQTLDDGDDGVHCDMDPTVPQGQAVYEDDNDPVYDWPLYTVASRSVYSLLQYYYNTSSNNNNICTNHLESDCTSYSGGSMPWGASLSTSCSWTNRHCLENRVWTMGGNGINNVPDVSMGQRQPYPIAEYVSATVWIPSLRSEYDDNDDDDSDDGDNVDSIDKVDGNEDTKTHRLGIAVEKINLDCDHPQDDNDEHNTNNNSSDIQSGTATTAGWLLRIVAIQPNSFFAASPLQVGHVLVSINGIPCQNMDPDHDLIRYGRRRRRPRKKNQQRQQPEHDPQPDPPKVTVTIIGRYDPSMYNGTVLQQQQTQPNSELFASPIEVHPNRVETMVEKPHPDAPIGIRFQGSLRTSIRITSISETGLCAHSLLNVGDRILAVNFVSCRTMTVRDVKERIGQAPRFVTILSESPGTTAVVLGRCMSSARAFLFSSSSWRSNASSTSNSPVSSSPSSPSFAAAATSSSSSWLPMMLPATALVSSYRTNLARGGASSSSSRRTRNALSHPVISSLPKDDDEANYLRQVAFVFVFCFTILSLLLLLSPGRPRPIS